MVMILFVRNKEKNILIAVATFNIYWVINDIKKITIRWMLYLHTTQIDTITTTGY